MAEHLQWLTGPPEQAYTSTMAPNSAINGYSNPSASQPEAKVMRQRLINGEEDPLDPSHSVDFPTSLVTSFDPKPKPEFEIESVSLPTTLIPAETPSCAPASVSSQVTRRVTDNDDNPIISSANAQDFSPAPNCTESSLNVSHQGSTSKGRHNHLPTPAATPRYDPNILLNPKSFKNNSTTDAERMEMPQRSFRNPNSNQTPAHFVFDSPSPAPSGPHLDEDGDTGMINLIERVHGVAEREDRPVKKLKTDHGSDGKPTATLRSKGGDISEHLHQKRKEGLEASDPVTTLVDLTGDDDDVVFVSAVDESEKIFCYGRMDSTKVQAHAVPFPNPKAPSLSKHDWPPMKLQLQRLPGKNFIVVVRDPAGKDFGNVDIRTAQGLVPLMDSNVMGVRPQARLSTRKRKPFELPGQLCSEYLDMTINLYGPKKNADAVGRFLSQRQIYLRTPYMVDNGIEVLNPHEKDKPRIPRHQYFSSGSTSYGSRTAEEVKNDVMGLFDSLEKAENLPQMEADDRIITPLLDHQKQGLHFMTNRETPRVVSDDEDGTSLWRMTTRSNGARVYCNVITGGEVRDRPAEVLGGILADMMGLGKTLSILSLIVGTLADAAAWAETGIAETDEGDSLKICSKTTLLVAPLSVVANWEEQIEAHIKPGTLKYYIYHGGSRIQDPIKLAGYDVVVTTYSIVSSEMNRRSRKRDSSPLVDTKFFRIVLDEAHMIREQSTMQSQAICKLSSQCRWALTGTPVQNKLDDLGALIKYLRVKPFDDPRKFSQYILAPFKNADPEILPKLRLLVDSITLRRLKDRIDLPQRFDQVVKLQFSKEERELYDWFAKDAGNKMRLITSGRKKSFGGRGYVHILQAILRLRLVSAHGKELLSEEDLKLVQGLNPTNAIDIDEEGDSLGDEKPVISARQAYELLMLCKETDTDTCRQCMGKIGPKDSPDDGNETIGFVLPCYLLICNDCYGGLRKSICTKTETNRFLCPYCDESHRLSFFELTQGGIEVAEEMNAKAKDNPRQAKLMGRYQGPHTKTTALVSCLLDSKAESLDHPDERPIKSVVFSGWTSHLDLIQIALEDNGISFVRLDGKMSRAQRNTSLERFREDASVTVILVSIMAGGLGLNLTTGSKVYVMEPQYNPAAEAQAIDRVHRLGQKREVTAVRFIMDDSVEESMLELQRKKQNLADLSMNRKMDKGEVARRRMEDLKSLFK